MFESLSTPPAGRLQDPPRRIASDAREYRSRAARDSSRVARGRRQFQGRQSVCRPRAGQGDGGRRNRRASEPGRRRSRSSDRSGRDGGPLRKRRRRAPDDESAPAGEFLAAGSCRGAGKTTTAGKLGKWLAKQGRHPLMVSTDVKRPAAIQQLNVVGQKASIRVHDPAGELDPVTRAKGAVAEAGTLGFRHGHRRYGRPPAHRRRPDGRAGRDQERDEPVRSALRRRCDDGAGRDQERRRVQPAGGRDRRRADEARRRRRAAARRFRWCRSSGLPIAFVGSGERLEDLEPFYPERVVSRVLGMGDVLSLIERAEAVVDVEDAQRPRAEASGETTSRSRIFAISCGRSGRWDRSSRSWGCCPGWATSRNWRRTSRTRNSWVRSRRSSDR